MLRVKSNDDAIERINTRFLPAGAAPLLSAELVARGLRGFQENVHTVPSIKSDLRLPSFTFAAHEPYEWPRRQ